MRIAIFKSDKHPEYYTSVDPTPYLLDPTALKGQIQPKDSTILLNPDVSRLANVPLKYWKKEGTEIHEMTTVEKQAVDAAELQVKKDAVRTLEVNIREALEAFIKVINLRLPKEQKITSNELIEAIKQEVK